jgi:peroxiredoxin family protein
MDMFGLEKSDLVAEVEGVLSAMDFFDKADGAQIIFV